MSLLENKVTNNVHQKSTSTDDDFVDHSPKISKRQGKWQEKAANDLKNEVTNKDFVDHPHKTLKRLGKAANDLQKEMVDKFHHKYSCPNNDFADPPPETSKR